MNVPQLRFKGFNDAWQIKKLKDIVKVTMGQSPSSTNYTQSHNDYILIQGNADLQNHQVVPRLWTTQKTKLAFKHDIIMTVRAPVGNVGILNYTQAVIGRGVASLKASDRTNNFFVYYLLTHLNQANFWHTYSAGSTFDSINSNDLKNAIINVSCEYTEQQKIGTFFSKLDDLITKQTHKVELLKQLKHGYLQKLFPQAGQTTPQLRFKEFNDEWQCKKLNDLIVKIIDNRGKTPPLDNNGNYALIEVNALINGKVNFDKVSKFVNKNTYDSWFRNHLKKDDILFSTVGNTGLTAIYEGNRFACVAQNIVGLRFNVNKYFMLANLENKNNIKKFKVIEMQAVQPSIKVTQLIKVKIPITNNKEEQQSIGALFAKLDHLIELQNRKLELLQELKKGYLQKMFI